MYYLMLQQEVADYDQWRAVFDSMQEVRRSVGVRKDIILRSADNPNEITLLIEFDNHENARNWMNDPRLKKAMQDAGVLNRKSVTYLIQD